MIDTMSNMITWAQKRDEKIFAAAQPGAVYGEPVTAGNYTVITASEIAAGGGFGSALGFGSSTTPPKQQGETSQPRGQPGNGGGLGGGGGSSGRPVAIIIIGPDGVTVKPVVDVTKIALASVTALGTMVIVLRRMRKVSKH